jgi:hypothetical protein
MPREIEQFMLGWHPQRGCAYRIRLKGTAIWSNWTSVSAADLAALAAIFKERAYYHPNGSISTGAEPVND